MGDEAEIAGAWGGTARRRLDRFALLAEIDLLGSKGESFPPTAGGHQLHPQQSFIEETRSLNVVYRQHEVIEAFYVHACPWPRRRKSLAAISEFAKPSMRRLCCPVATSQARHQ